MVDPFFILGAVPDTIVKGYYNYSLVALSCIVASLASFVALDMASNIASTTHAFGKSLRSQKFWLCGGAFAMGAGIWSAHFIGMLAYNAGMEVHYDFWVTLLSLAVAIFLSFFALIIVQVENLHMLRIIHAAPILGMGIVTMHYTGMVAMEMKASLRYMPGLFAVSIIIAITGSAIALWLAFHATKNSPGKGTVFKIVAALVMGGAICGMHYSGIAAAVFIPYADCRIDYTAFDKNITMASAVACVTFLILGLAIIASIINQKFIQHLSSEIENRTSELKEANTKLEKTEKLALAGELRMKMILNHIIDGVIAINERGVIQSFNKAAEHIFGYTQEEVVHKNIKMLMPEKDAQKHHNYLTSYLKTGVGKIIGVGREVEGLRKNGDVFPADLGINEVMLHGERIFIGVVRDISTQKEYERQLYKVKEAAEQANRMKSEFLANMSHELRTPLNSLLILSEELTENQAGNLTDRQVKAAKIIHGSGHDLLALINDILDLAKIEAGKIDLHIESVTLDTLSLSIKQKFQMVAEKKGLDLIIAVAPDMPEVIYTDAIRLEQVLRNFLANAFKFTHHGSVTLQFSRPKPNTAFKSKTLTHEHCLAISVTDTGIGIPADKKEAIFEAFQQADGSTNRKYGGTGLGLSISLEISQLIGGEIQLESTVGEGSTFTLYIPETLAPQDINVNAEQIKTSGISLTSQHTFPEWVSDDRNTIAPGDHTVLIIEDDEHFAQILYNEATQKGLKSIVTQSGNEGIRLAEKHLPTGIILDLALPDINGLVVIETLKHNQAAAHIPVYVISIEEDTMRTFEKKGAAGYMTKPVSRENIKKIMEKIREGIPHPTQKIAPPQAPSSKTPTPANANREEASHPTQTYHNLKGKAILVADDDMRNTFALFNILDSQGMNVILVSDGKQAIEELTSHPEIDIVVMDIMMPGMDGYETIRHIRAEPHFKELPIIAVTAKAMQEDKEKCLQAGAIDYLSKPIDKHKLLALLDHYLGHSKNTKAAGNT